MLLGLLDSLVMLTAVDRICFVILAMLMIDWFEFWVVRVGLLFAVLVV